MVNEHESDYWPLSNLKAFKERNLSNEAPVFVRVLVTFGKFLVDFHQISFEKFDARSLEGGLKKGKPFARKIIG